jgi:hypothetical protein
MLQTLVKTTHVSRGGGIKMPSHSKSLVITIILKILLLLILSINCGAIKN